MPEPKSGRGRYDGQSILPHLTARTKFNGAQFYIHAPLHGDSDFVIYFVTSSSQIDDTFQFQHLCSGPLSRANRGQYS